MTELKFKLNYSFINQKRIIFLGISGIKFSTRIFYRGVRNANTSLHLLHSRGIHPPRSTVIPAWDLSHSSSRGKADFFLEANSPPSIQLKIRSNICNCLCW